MTRGQLNWRLAHADNQDSADEAQEQFDWEQGGYEIAIPGLARPQIFPQDEETQP